MSEANKHPGEYHAAYDDYKETTWHLVQAVKALHGIGCLPVVLTPLLMQLEQAEERLRNEFEVVAGAPHLITRRCSCPDCSGSQIRGV